MSASLSLFKISTVRSPTIRPAGTRRRPTVRIVAVSDAPTATRRPASLYQVLRVKETATPREIKAAYRSMAKQFHPDVAGTTATASGSPDFLEIHRAYATLSDPAARAQYDRSIVGFGLGFGLAGDSRLRSRTWETDQCW